MDENKVHERFDSLETKLREIFKLVNVPNERLNLMQLRVSAYNKINRAADAINKLLEIIETEFVTEIDECDNQIIFLNRDQEESHNTELDYICIALREILEALLSPPGNYQNDSKKEIKKTV